METSDEIIIPIDKKKLFLLLIGSILFTILTFIYIVYPKELTSNVYRSHFMIFLIGIIGFAFFGLASIYLFKKLFDTKPGLIISKEGIFDNSNATPIGLIEWKDIVSSKTIKVYKQRMVLIKVKNPNKYISRQTSKRRKNVFNANNNYFGTPIVISANGLKIEFDKLENLINDQINKNKNN
jgi:hypothetical protein